MKYGGGWRNNSIEKTFQSFFQMSNIKTERAENKGNNMHVLTHPDVSLSPNA